MDKDAKRAVAIGLAASALLGATELLRNGANRKRRLAAQVFDASASVREPIIETDWDLPEVRNDRVDFFMEFLLSKRRDDMTLWIERLGKYGPLIRAELRERGMPQDLVYLAMIESGFDSNAHSSADAVGIWQFIAPTARRYGLEVSDYVDERRDPVKATGAALDYLGDLHDQFGSWFLAAAAYNTGEGRIEDVLDRYAGGDRGEEELYWRISAHIPRETRDYVPLMLAAAHISKEPDKYGLPEPEFQEPLRFAEVSVPGGTPLSEVAEKAGVSEDTIRALNAALVRGITPPDREWQVRVPVEQADQFAANLATRRPTG